MSIRRLGAWFLILVMALGAGSVMSPAVADEPAVSNPMVGAPAVGTCYLTTAKQDMALSLKQTPISCAKKHTLWVVGAVQAPESLDLSALNDELFEWGDKACGKIATKALGGARALVLSSYEQHFHVPTAALQADGARWLSCAVGIAQKNWKMKVTKKRKAVRLTDSKAPVLRLCSTTKAWTNCAAKHSYRAVAAVKVAPPKSAKKWESLAVRVCSPKVSSRMFMWRVRIAKADKVYLVCLESNSR